MNIDLEMSSPTKPEPTCLIMSLPDEVVIDIIARVSTRFHPSISAVCRRFRTLVASPELYEARRSLLGRNEHCLYVILKSTGENSESRVYNLRRRPDGGRRLVHISSLPVMPREASFVAAADGSRIHVFGGFSLYDRREPSALSIDCRYHTVQPLPAMPKPMTGTPLAHMMDEKIYVFGCTDYHNKVTAVFNTKTQTWEPEMTEPCIELRHMLHGPNGSVNTIIYDVSEETKWKQKFDTWKNVCVIDDAFYSYDRLYNKLIAYDTKHRDWKEVKGVGTLSPGKKSAVGWPRAVNYGGKLLFLYEKMICRTRELWCAEIAVERRQEGREIWGKVEWSDLVSVGDFDLIESIVAMP
ncbi:F-box/kelch-repeat protein At4g38940-like [Raphanus sativus]|uniref:F-box/kelch-repeat protein At4g38940-like n=1 Tax=Raphanus sativus TaxID=3726 RepID=A0A6J0JL80_RAPSA|nr:F-box/kelch-repeat protein At4g38940-like [Raphanus sativus]